ncbi:alpha-galactosidase [Pedobacter glucosidilyticus]|uniref:alpha-galactosidase n=1 Tax=Pedobacter glucosidilyticus TaxID=1122941 RepID=UPI000425F01C|nr:alpha-galactosidase [Pedobacter glucosidilyticus]
MKKTTVVFLFLNILFRPLFSQSIDCKAELVGDNLIISNNLVSFFYNWNNGNIEFKGYQEKGSSIIQANETIEDLKLFSKPFLSESATLTSSVKKRFNGEQKFLEVIVNFKLNSINIRRIIEIFPNSPSLRTYYYVKGSPQESWINITKKQVGTEIIEDLSSLNNKMLYQRLGCVPLIGKHWEAKAVSFRDVTDHNNTLVFEDDYLPYSKPIEIKANILLLRNSINNAGIFILKESPISSSQQAYPGVDFSLSLNRVEVLGTGIEKSFMNNQEWQRSYGYVIGVSSADETSQLIALRTYQKAIRSLRTDRDEMIMSNTWGDRNKDSRMNEAFILKELEAAAKLGITHFQLDDGWQQGLSSNSAQKGGKNWDSWTEEDWQAHSQRFPRGLKPIADKAKSLNIKLGLWFNPSSGNDYKTWERDADILIGYYHQFQISAFKIDGVELKSKEAEENLRKFFERVMEKTDGNAIFNLDVTAGRRSGFHFFNEYGNIFLENRYTDWSNYYPHTTLRNLWMLSRYLPSEKLQIEWLNPWRNISKYSNEDMLAPSKIPMEYIVATTFMAQPLAWMEISNLPDEGFKIADIIKIYRGLQHDMHEGVILPIGKMPDGFSLTGFQSIKDSRGYFIFFNTPKSSKKIIIKTFLKPNERIKLIPVMNGQQSFNAKVNSLSEIKLKLKPKNSFCIYKYEKLNQ